MRRRNLIGLVALAGVAACAGVLGLRKAPPKVFPHRAHVIKGVSCVTCHRGLESASNTGPLHLPDGSGCTAAKCHDKPHDPNPCLECHTDPMTAVEVAESRAHLRFEHRRHLSGAAFGNCMRCHASVAEGDSRLRPGMAVCWGCHEHERVRDIRDCDACHVGLDERYTPPQSHIIHDGDFIKNHGTQAAASADLCGTCHTERTCAKCHGVSVPAVPARLRFADPMAASVHRAGFRSRHAAEARAAPGACSTCHQPQQCAECHLAQGVIGDGAVSPHPPGWVSIGGPGQNRHGQAARIDPAACAACHGGAGEALCVQCHRVGGVGGNPHPPGWNRDQPLTALPCRLCHTVGAVP